MSRTQNLHKDMKLKISNDLEIMNLHNQTIKPSIKS